LARVYCARTLLGRCVCKRVDVNIITLSCTWRIYALSELLLVPSCTAVIDCAKRTISSVSCWQNIQYACAENAYFWTPLKFWKRHSTLSLRFCYREQYFCDYKTFLFLPRDAL